MLNENIFSIRKQTMLIEADSEALAISLQSKIPDFNRRRLVPLIHTAMQAENRQNKHIHIDKLEIDLGWINIDEFEDVVEQRLEQIFSQQLSETIAELLEADDNNQRSRHRVLDHLVDKPRQASSKGNVQASIQSKLSVLERYLMTGTLPWGVHNRAKFDFEKILIELMSTDSSAVVNLIKTSSQTKTIIERLVIQLKQSSLQKLLNLLEPKHGWLIISYISDLNTLYIIKPILPINKQVFSRLLWMLTLNYSVKEHGSQFNRQSFVKTLLKNMARSEGLQYFVLLETLNLRIRKNSNITILQSSLPALIARLIEEQYKTGNSKAPASSLDSRFADRDGDKLNFSAAKAATVKQNFELKWVNSLALLENHFRRKNGDDNFSRLKKQRNGEVRRFIELVERSNSGALTLLRQLMVSLFSNYSSNTSLMTERILNVFSPSVLLEVFKIKQKKLVLSWAEILTDGIRQLSTTKKDSSNNTKKYIWHSIMHFLMNNQAKPLDIQSMVESSIFKVAKSFEIEPTKFVDHIRRLADSNTETTSGSILGFSIDKLKYTALNSSEINHNDDSQYTVSSSQAKQFFEPYDSEEPINMFLRHSVLPWQIVWSQPDKRINDYLAGLSQLPSDRLKAQLRSEKKDDQVSHLQRLVKILEIKELNKIFKRLLPIQFSALDEFEESVYLALDSTSNKQGLCVSLLVSLLNEENIDLELDPIVAFDDKVLNLEKSITSWSHHQLLSELVRRLKNSAYLTARSPSSREIVETLLAQYPAESKGFMVELYAVPDLMGELVEQCEKPTFHKILALLQPVEFGILETLMGSLESIPMPYRPNIKLLRQIVLKEAIVFQRPINGDFFARVFSQLFQGSLSKTLKNHLLKSVDDFSLNRSFKPSIESDYRDAILRYSVKVSELQGSGEKTVLSERTGRFVPSKLEVGELINVESFADSEQRLQGLLFRFLCGEITEEQLNRINNESSQRKISSYQLQQLTIRCFERSQSALRIFVRRYIKQQNVRDIWLSRLPEKILARFIWLLEPNPGLPLFQDAEIMCQAYSETVVKPGVKPILRIELWRFILLYFSNTEDTKPNLNDMTRQFFTYFYESKNEQGNAEVFQILVERMVLLSRARASSKNSLQNMLQQRTNRHDSLESENKNNSLALLHSKANKPNRMSVERSAISMDQWSHSATETENKLYKDNAIYVDNAGLILVAAFLPHLLSSLDMLDEFKKGKKRLRDPKTFSRAVHLLQYLVDGSTSTKEPLLVLNKILCGESPQVCVESSIEMSEQEISICNQLLNAMLSRWECLSNTKIEGLQQTFLQREGRLEKTDDGWKLTIQRKTVDVLVDQIPWRISIISEAWMPDSIFVKW